MSGHKPIGLITADEVAYAGGVWLSSNNGYYLYTNQYYCTMSPYNFDVSGYAFVFHVFSAGHLNTDWVSSASGVRPVINLSADVTITGAGITSNPFEVL